MSDDIDWAARIRAAFATAPQQPDEDVVAELAEHAASVHADALSQGCCADEAVGRVLREVAQWQSEAAGLKRKRSRALAVDPPPAVPGSWLAALWYDFCYAVRAQRRQLKFAGLVVCSLALGIGATATLFNVTYDVLVKPLPWPNAARLVSLTETRGGNAPRFGAFSNAVYLAWRDDAQTVDALAAWSPGTVTLTDAGDAERIRIVRATASLFSVLGIRPLQGSLFVPEQETVPVVVLAEGTWRSRFAGDPDVVGKVVQLDGQPHTVVGVVSGATMFPDRQTAAILPMNVPPVGGGNLTLFNALASLRPGVTPGQVRAEGTVRGGAALDAALTATAIFGRNGPVEVAATPFAASLTGNVRNALLVLLAAGALLLVAATANVANLQLARVVARQREFALRAALGSGRARIYRQALLENVVLGIVGGALGVALAWALHGALRRVLPADFPRLEDLSMDVGVSALALLLAVAVSAACTLALTTGLQRVDPRLALGDDGAAVAGAMPRSVPVRARLVIMVAQVAIACVLLVGASLLGRSFLELLDADRGFDPSRVLSARLAMPSFAFTPERRTAVLDQILERLKGTTDARGVAFTSEFPLTPGGSTSAFTLPARDENGERVTVQASPRVVSPDYFAALGLPIVNGRGFEEEDGPTAAPVVVVNETFARRYLGAAPLGAKLPMALWGQNQEGDATVVGIAADVRYVASPAESMAELYFSHRQLTVGVRTPSVTLLVRSDADPRMLTTAMHSAVRETDQSLVAELIVTLEDRLTTSLARPRLYAVLLGGFAALAVVVAAVGLFGVLSYLVVQRTRELGIRAALGASPRDLLRIVLRFGLGATIAGLAVGLVAAAVLMRFVTTLLYGVTTSDLATYLGVPVLLLLVAAVACFLPARRAARLDPLRALRQ